MNEILAPLSSVAALIIAGLSLFLVIWNFRDVKKTVKKYEPMIETVEDTLSIFQIEQGEDGKLIVDNRLQMLVAGVSKAIAETMKMSFLGSLSGQVRLEKGLKGAITTDMIEKKMPLLNLAGDFLGINTTKYLQKHPEALGQLLQLAGPLLPSLLGRNNGQGANQQFNAATNQIGVMP